MIRGLMDRLGGRSRVADDGRIDEFRDILQRSRIGVTWSVLKSRKCDRCRYLFFVLMPWNLVGREFEVGNGRGLDGVRGKFLATP